MEVISARGQTIELTVPDDRAQIHIDREGKRRLCQTIEMDNADDRAQNHMSEDRKKGRLSHATEII